jgi:DNA-binding CsgD family transcriptional regulator
MQALGETGGVENRMALQASSQESGRESGRATVSRREFQIVELMVRAQDATAIAHDLKISPKTVAAHIYRIYKKLKIRRRAELFRLWYQGEVRLTPGGRAVRASKLHPLSAAELATSASKIARSYAVHPGTVYKERKRRQRAGRDSGARVATMEGSGV